MDFVNYTFTEKMRIIAHNPLVRRKNMIKKEIVATVHKELGVLEQNQGKYGPNVAKAQVVHYGEAGKPGLSIQNFYIDADGVEQFGKRPLLTKPLLEWIRDNDLINKALEELG